MSYTAKIEGTRYTVELEKKYNEWFLVLKIDGDPIEEVAVPEMSAPSVAAQINNLLEPISYMINPLIMQKIIDELIGKSVHLFRGISRDEGREVTTVIQEQRSDAQIQEAPTGMYPVQLTQEIGRLREDITMLMDSMQELNERVSEIDVRLSHVEKITKNLALITDKFLVEKDAST